jgi:hypothetical protein
MDPSIQHSFRSGMINDINKALTNLIEGEAALKRAFGRLWKAIEETPNDENTNHIIGPRRVSGRAVSRQRATTPKDKPASSIPYSTRIAGAGPRPNGPLDPKSSALRVFLNEASLTNAPAFDGSGPPIESLLEAIESLK